MRRLTTLRPLVILLTLLWAISGCGGNAGSGSSSNPGGWAPSTRSAFQSHVVSKEPTPDSAASTPGIQIRVIPRPGCVSFLAFVRDGSLKPLYVKPAQVSGRYDGQEVHLLPAPPASDPDVQKANLQALKAGRPGDARWDVYSYTVWADAPGEHQFSFQVDQGNQLIVGQVGHTITGLDALHAHVRRFRHQSLKRTVLSLAASTPSPTPPDSYNGPPAIQSWVATIDLDSNFYAPGDLVTANVQLLNYYWASTASVSCDDVDSGTAIVDGVTTQGGAGNAMGYADNFGCSDNPAHGQLQVPVSGLGGHTVTFELSKQPGSYAFEQTPTSDPANVDGSTWYGCFGGLGQGYWSSFNGFVVSDQRMLSIQNLQGTAQGRNYIVSGTISASAFTPTNLRWQASVVSGYGQTLRQYPWMPGNTISLTWDGNDENGSPLPDGQYSIQVQAACDEGVSDEQLTDVDITPQGYLHPQPGSRFDANTGRDNNGGDPVNGLTGGFYYSQADISIPTAGAPLSVTRVHQTQQLTNSNMPAVWQWNVVSWADESVAGADLLKFTYPDGRWAEFQSGDLVHFTPTATYANLTDTVTRNADGSLDVLSKDGSQTHFIPYQSNATDLIYLIAGVRDRFGNSLTWQYQNGAITSIQSSSGRSLQFVMDPVGVGGGSPGAPAPYVDVKIYQITDDLGRVWSYSNYLSFAGLGSAPATVTYPANRTWNYTYDSGARLLTVTDPKGRLTISNTYDSTDTKVVHQVRAGGDEWDYAYTVDSAGLAGPPPSGTPNPLTAITRSHNGVPQGTQTTVYDQASGLPIWQSDELLNVTTSSYDPGTGRLLSTTDPLGNVTRLQWDSRGNLTSSTDSLGNTWTYEYEPAFNTITKRTSPLGQVWQYSRDGLGLVTSAVDPLGNTRTYSYNSAGEPTLLTDPLGHATAIEYNASGDVVGVTNPLHQKTVFRVDAVGRLKATIDPLGHTTTQTIDHADRVTSVQDAMGNTSSFTWDHADNLVTSVDALNRTTNYAYNAINNATQVSDALGGTTRLAYDGRDNVQGVTNANGVLTAGYTQNQGDETVAETLAGDGSSSSYDGDHRLVSRVTPNGVTITYGYDAVGHLTSRVSSDGTVNVHYQYDAAGRRSEMDDPTGSSVYYYYDDNRLEQVIKNNRWVGYIYDTAGRLVNVVGAQLSGSTTTFDLNQTFAYDAAGRLKRARQGDQWVDFTYDAAGRTLSKTFSNGSTCTLAYDDDNRVTSIQWSGPVPASYTYTYDAVGNRISATETGSPQGPFTWQYQVDALNRLVQAVVNGSVTTTWRLDAVGNILEQDQSDSTAGTQTRQLFAVNSKDQVTARGQAPYVWDADGNLVSKTLAQGTKTTTYTWDAEDHLIGITFPDGTTEQNAYDGDGRRVQTINRQGVTTVFEWSGGDLLDEDAPDGTPRMRYLVTGGVVQGARQGANQYVFQTDSLCSVRQVVDGSGAKVASYDFQPYGAQQGTALDAGVSPEVTACRFSGGLGVRYDQSSGLYYMRARWYDPYLGRFVSRDPLDLVGGINVYTYCNANPLDGVDPNGLVDWDLVQQGIIEIGKGGILVIMGSAEVGIGGGISGSGVGVAVAPAVIAAGVTTAGGGVIYAGRGLGLILAGTLASTSASAGSNSSASNSGQGTPCPKKLHDLTKGDPTLPPDKGWEWRGPDAPGGARGAWYNPATKESLHPDLQHPDPIGPHWDYTDTQGNAFRIFPDGRMIPKP